MNQSMHLLVAQQCHSISGHRLKTKLYRTNALFIKRNFERHSINFIEYQNLVFDTIYLEN